MTRADIKALLEGKRGGDFVDAMREIALLASAQSSTVRCGACRKRPALYLGMQRCGAPGGPICEGCLDHHRDWLNTAQSIAEARPYCRHCNEDVGRDHIYAVDLFDPTAPEVVM